MDRVVWLRCQRRGNETVLLFRVSMNLIDGEHPKRKKISTVPCVIIS